jgi:hypothetical protein
MRAIGTWFSAVVAIGLLAGSAVGVAAQEEEVPEVASGSSYFTGTLMPAWPPVDRGTVAVSPDGFSMTRDMVLPAEAIETSDPRVSGSLSRVLSYDAHTLAGQETGPEYLEHYVEAWRLENEGGSWTGQGTSFVHNGAVDEPTDLVTMVLTGEGGYEGLTAYVLVDFTQQPIVVEGGVFVGEAIPAPEPPAE